MTCSTTHLFRITTEISFPEDLPRLRFPPPCASDFPSVIWRLWGRAPPFLHPSCLTPGEDHPLCYCRCLSESLLPASPKVCSSFLFGEKEDDERRSRDTSRTGEFFTLSPTHNLPASAEPLTDSLRARQKKQGQQNQEMSFIKFPFYVDAAL